MTQQYCTNFQLFNFSIFEQIKNYFNDNYQQLLYIDGHKQYDSNFTTVSIF